MCVYVCSRNPRFLTQKKLATENSCCIIIELLQSLIFLSIFSNKLVSFNRDVVKHVCQSTWKVNGKITKERSYQLNKICSVKLLAVVRWVKSENRNHKQNKEKRIHCANRCQHEQKKRSRTHLWASSLFVIKRISHM